MLCFIIRQLKSCFVVLHRPPLIFENLRKNKQTNKQTNKEKQKKKLFFIQKYTAPNFQN